MARLVDSPTLDPPPFLAAPSAVEKIRGSGHEALLGPRDRSLTVACRMDRNQATSSLA
jgi:hypothetical protein